MIQSLEGMDLTDRIREMSRRIAKRLNSIKTEEATKTALYEPPFSNLHAGGPDELFVGQENVIEGIFDRLKAVHSKLIAKTG